jgi:hypothetical protein
MTDGATTLGTTLQVIPGKASTVRCDFETASACTVTTADVSCP